MKITFFIVLLFLSGCETLKGAAVALGDATGNQKLAKSGADLTPKQEYYLGRTLAAQSVSQTPVVDDAAAENYVNLVGHYLAIHSARPETYRGYQFAILQSKDPMAFSFPGGYVFVSTGMLKFLNSEDELAAVLSHELAHLRLQHPQKSIQAANRVSLFGDLAQAGLVQSGTLTAEATTESYKLFDGAVGALLNKGFEQPQEIEADRYAVQLLTSAGFDRDALGSVLGRLKDNATFTGRHPSNQERLAALAGLRKPASVVDGAAVDLRTARFRAAQNSIK